MTRARILGLLLLYGSCFESSLAWAQADTLPVSLGRYRIPYANATTVRASNDHTSHPTTLNRIDLVGQDGAPYTIVAAARGWLRLIEDDNTLWCPAATGGNPNPCGILPSTQCCERNDNSCNANCRNNFVWIEHTNGEWTKYSHMNTGSVAANGHQLNDFVQAGEALGIQGRIGFASGPHLHFEAARPHDGIDSFDSAGFLVGDGDGSSTDYNRQNRIAAFCNGGVSPIWVANEQRVAANCPGACIGAQAPADVIGDGEVIHRQAGTITPSPAHRVLAGGGEALFASTRITLGPGFRAHPESYFSAGIGPCNSPGGD